MVRPVVTSAARRPVAAVLPEGDNGDDVISLDWPLGSLRLLEEDD